MNFFASECSFMAEHLSARSNRFNAYSRVMELTSDIPGFKCSEPEGAFYIFPDVSYYYGKKDGENTITNSADFSMYLLNTAHVSSVMGEAFGEPNCVRFSFANSMNNIERAWVRIKEALSKLK